MGWGGGGAVLRWGAERDLCEQCDAGLAGGAALRLRQRWAYAYNTRGEVAAASAKWADGITVAGEQFGTVGPGGVATAEDVLGAADANAAVRVNNERRPINPLRSPR